MSLCRCIRLQKPASDQHLRAVRRLVDQQCRDETLRPVSSDRQVEARLAEDVQRRVQDVARGTTTPLRHRSGNRSACRPGSRRSTCRRPPRRTSGASMIDSGVPSCGRIAQCPGIQPSTRSRHSARAIRPPRPSGPAARFCVPAGGDAVLQPEPQRRLVHQPGVDALEPVIPEPDELGHEIDLRRWASLRAGRDAPMGPSAP